MSGKTPDTIFDSAWDSTVEGLGWLKNVLLGEFADNRSRSEIVADMLVSFVPGVVIVTSARDAVAVILRLAQHPEKREELMEWVLLCACLIGLAIPLVMAAGGAVAAGVGAIVGGIAGSELGAILRGVMLMLIKKSGKLIELIQFLQKYVRGDIVRLLQAIRFVKYEKALLKVLTNIIKKLVEVCVALRRRLDAFKSFKDVQAIIAKLAHWEHKFYAVQTEAVKKIPLAMAELQLRLTTMLAELTPKEAHVVTAGVKAEKPLVQAIKVQRVKDVAGRPLMAEGKGAKASSGAHSAPSEKLVPDKIAVVPEPPNTKRQATHEPETPHLPAALFDYPRDLSRRVAEEAQVVIKAGAEKGPAIARVGSHALGLESPSFFNFSRAELGSKVPRFPGVVPQGGGDYLVIDDVDKYIAALRAVYLKLDGPLNAEIEKAIRKRIAGRARLSMIDGLPGAHAEVRAQNWFLNKAGSAKGAPTYAVTYKLLGKNIGDPFIACSHCSRILSPEIIVVTGRSK